MPDGRYGKVEIQTPDIVQINTLRGSFQAYTTSDFIKQHPRNLSINLFSVNNILNIDFKHSDIVLEQVPEKVKLMLEEKIKEQFYGEYLKRILVELKEFDHSSLNVITIAQFSGEVASEYTEIGWLLQQETLDACNKYGWKIAHKQITLHQAETIKKAKK